MPGPGKTIAEDQIPPLPIATRFRSINSRVKENVNWIIIVIGVTSLLIFVGIMIAVFVITLRRGSSEEPKVIPDKPGGHVSCVDRRRKCYKTNCDQPYTMAKNTTVDGEPCVSVQPPYTKNYVRGICVMDDSTIPWCYITSIPPLKTRPCYRFCDEQTDCIDKSRSCYHAEKKNCNGKHFAYNEEYNWYLNETLDLKARIKCSKSSYMPSCMLRDSARAPFCHDNHGNISFCYPSCKALNYLEDHHEETAQFQYHRNERIISEREPLDTFYGINRKGCALLCSRTKRCYYYSSIRDGNGKCELFDATSFNKKAHRNGAFGWIYRNDTIVLYGGKEFSRRSKSMKYVRRISTLRIDEGKPVWSFFNTQSPIREQMSPRTTSTDGRFYALSYNSRRNQRFIEQYVERGLKKRLFANSIQDVRYPAVVGVNDALFMCGGLNVSNGRVRSDAVRNCSIVKIGKWSFYESKFHLNDTTKLYQGFPRDMLLPRVHFSLVHYGGAIFAFMGCSKRVEDCTEMVKPIHYFVIPQNTWYETGTSMQIERINYGHATYKDKVYVCGGLNPADRSEVLDSCEVYQIVLCYCMNLWKVPEGKTVIIKELPARTQQLAMVVVGDLLLAIGGRHSTDETNVSKAIYRYDDSDDSWKLFSYMNRSRYGMGVAVI